jgi:hypothetical protein
MTLGGQRCRLDRGQKLRRRLIVVFGRRTINDLACSDLARKIFRVVLGISLAGDEDLLSSAEELPTALPTYNEI